MLNTTEHAPSRASIIGLLCFTGLYMLASIFGAISARNTEFIFYITVMFVLIGFTVLVHKRVTFSAGVLWCLSVWGAMHMAGGLVPVPASWPIDGDFRVLYSWWIIPGPDWNTPGDGVGGFLKYDQLTHAFGFGVTTWACWQAFRGAMRGQTGDAPIRPTLGLMALMIVAGVGFGALNEVVEFIATRIGETNVGGYVNTGLDLIFNTIGATVAATAIFVRGRLTSRAGTAPRPDRA